MPPKNGNPKRTALSAPALSQTSPAHKIGCADGSNGIATVPAAQVIVGQRARSLQQRALSAPVLSQGFPAQRALLDVPSATVPEAQLSVEQGSRGGPLSTPSVYVPKVVVPTLVGSWPKVSPKRGQKEKSLRRKRDGEKGSNRTCTRGRSRSRSSPR